MENRNFEILEIRTNTVLVSDNFGFSFPVAKEQDENGVYILNGQLEKQYISEPTAIMPKKKAKNSNLETFEFYVEYWHGDDTRRKVSSVKAKDFDSALTKVKRNFKSIVEIEEF